MFLKAELETWAAALKAYDEEYFEQSLDLFSVSLAVLPVACLTHLPLSVLLIRPRFSPILA